MRGDRFAYFLNAVHYCIWRGSRRLQLVIDKVIGRFLLFFGVLFLSPKKQERLDIHIANREKETYGYFNNKKRGFHILFANDNFGFFYGGYSIFISFLLNGIYIRVFEYINPVLLIVMLVVPIWLCYIPAYRAVFTNDNYLKYYKKFEKMDKSWHRKWVMITWAFCDCGILAFFVGIIALFAFAIGWYNVHLPFSGY